MCLTWSDDNPLSVPIILEQAAAEDVREKQAKRKAKGKNLREKRQRQAFCDLDGLGVEVRRAEQLAVHIV